MSRFVAVCLLLSISQISVSRSDSMTSFSKRVLSDLGAVVAEKPNVNCLTLRDEFKKCQKEPQDNSAATFKKDFPYDQNCLQRLNENTNQALKNNFQLFGAGMVGKAGVHLVAAVVADLRCSNTAHGLRSGYNYLAFLPSVALIVDTLGLWMVKCDAAHELNKFKKKSRQA